MIRSTAKLKTTVVALFCGAYNYIMGLRLYYTLYLYTKSRVFDGALVSL